MHTQAKMASISAELGTENFMHTCMHAYTHTYIYAQTQAKMASIPAGSGTENFASLFSSSKFDKCDDELEELRDMIASLKKETEELQVCMHACVHVYVCDDDIACAARYN